MLGFSPLASAPLGDDGADVQQAAILASASGVVGLSGASTAANVVRAEAADTPIRYWVGGAGNWYVGNSTIYGTSIGLIPQTEEDSKSGSPLMTL